MAVGRSYRNAYARADHNLMAFDLKRLCNAVDHALREHASLARSLQVGLQDHKLIAAETRDRVDLASAILQALGHCPQQGIADRMSERIVDRLEVIEIEAEHGETF